MIETTEAEFRAADILNFFRSAGRKKKNIETFSPPDISGI